MTTDQQPEDIAQRLFADLQDRIEEIVGVGTIEEGFNRLSVVDHLVSLLEDWQAHIELGIEWAIETKE